MKEIQKWLLLALLCLTPHHHGVAKISPFFSPSTDCRDKLIDFLSSAKATIDVAIYALTSEEITNALLLVNNKKIRLRILADKLQASGRYSTVKELYYSGVNIRVHSVKRIQHNKYVVVDGKKIMTGSFNFTESATKYNNENCVFITANKTAADYYQKNFNKLWRKNTKSKSDAWFARH